MPQKRLEVISLNSCDYFLYFHYGVRLLSWRPPRPTRSHSKSQPYQVLCVLSCPHNLPLSRSKLLGSFQSWFSLCLRGPVQGQEIDAQTPHIGLNQTTPRRLLAVTLTGIARTTGRSYRVGNGNNIAFFPIHSFIHLMSRWAATFESAYAALRAGR